MHKAVIVSATLIAALTSGCASHLLTYGADKKESLGIPVPTPKLVKVTEKTTYKVIPGNESKSKYCTEEINSSQQLLALGEINYINFKPATLGKGEFKVEFSDAGTLKSVSINSDATAGAEQVGKLIGATLPYIAKPKATPEAANELEVADNADPAQKSKEKYCLKQGTEIVKIENIAIQ